MSPFTLHSTNTMYKTKLQELCQKNSWSLPVYETNRDGPPHNARFTTTVTVNEIPFHSTSPSRTAKQSQSSAAMLAFNHFSQQISNPISIPFLPNFPSFPQPSLSSSPGSSGHSPDVGFIDQPDHNGRNRESSSGHSPDVGCIDQPDHNGRNRESMLHVYKNQLQSYAHKRNFSLPAYTSEWEGPPHAMRFKSKVTIDGQTFESPKFYSTLKDAEHAAAEVALMTLSPSGLQEDNSGLYKNLLQEVVQKEGFRLPLYTTQKSGEAHMPIFVSQVEVEGELFTGQEAKSKKQAETSAAKVAYTTLKERKAHQGQALEFPPNCSEENVITSLQHLSNRKSPVKPGLVIGNKPNKDKGESDQSSLFPLSANHRQGPYLTSDHPKSNVGTDLQHNSDSNSLVSHGLVTHNQPNKYKVEKGPSSVGSVNGGSEKISIAYEKPFPSCSDSKNVASEKSDMPSTAVSTPSGGKKKVIVYSRKTNVEIEEGGTLFPFSDDKWVAYAYSQ